jgi:hypothetical protein
LVGEKRARGGAEGMRRLMAAMEVPYPAVRGKTRSFQEPSGCWTEKRSSARRRR